MRTKTYQLAKSKVIVELKNNMFYIVLNGKRYYAEYDFNIESIPEHHIDLMVFIIFYNFDENRVIPYKKGHVQIPEFDIKKTYKSEGERMLLSFSGGYDSTAVKILLPDAIPVYLLRNQYDLYCKNQLRILKKVNAIIVKNDIEQLRIQYKGSKGFNVGSGYASLLIPYLSRHKANTILTGGVYDDVAFNYSESLKYVNSVNEYSATHNIMRWLKRAGINLCFPVGCISEVLTTKLGEESVYRDIVSSCHVEMGSANHCLKCYKCFRKMQIIGKGRLKPEALKSFYVRSRLKPLKMALSTTYAIQKGGFKGDAFSDFMNIDVSFAEKYDSILLNKFNNPELVRKMEAIYKKKGISPMNEQDYNKINEFVKHINLIGDKYQ